MITIFPEKKLSTIKKIYSELNFTFSKNSGVTVARSGSEILGYCLYELYTDKIVIIDIIPKEDILLVDGILRSALHIADFKGITAAFYSDIAPVSLFKTLDFIKDEEEKSLKIEKLHQSSCSCEKNIK